jgi:hypothetical protein
MAIRARRSGTLTITCECVSNTFWQIEVNGEANLSEMVNPSISAFVGTDYIISDAEPDFTA